MTDVEAEVGARLRARGGRSTRQRREVLRLFLERREGDVSLTAAQVVDELRVRGTGVDRATVYRALDTLADLGVLRLVVQEPRSIAYRLAG
jgi:Fe2+ or Zn2+ uptake regulation protein